MKKILLLLILSISINSAIGFNTYLEQTLNLRILNEEQSQAKKEEVCDNLSSSVKDGDVVDDDQRKSWKNNSDRIASARGDNELEKNLSGESDDWMPFITQILIFTVPFLVFAVFSLFGFFTYICCFTCENICPCCKVKKEHKGISKYWPLVGSLVTQGIIFIIAIIGLSYAAGLENSYHTFFCTGMTAFHGLTYGAPDEKDSYQGIVWAKEQLLDIQDNKLTTLQTQSDNTFNGDTSAYSDQKTKMDYISSAQLADCSDLVNQCCLDGNSYCTDAAVDWNTFNANVPDNFVYVLGPDGIASNANSEYFGSPDDITSPWGKQVQASKELYTGAYNGMIDSVNSIEASAKSMQSDSGLDKSLDDGIKAMVDYEGKSLDFLTDLQKYHSDTKGIFSGVTKAMVSFYWILIIFSMVVVALQFLVYKMKYYNFRLPLHFFWCFYSFIMIFLFLITSVFMAISLGGQSLCEIMDYSLNDPVKFDEYTAKLDENIKGKMKICKRELNLPEGEYGGDDSVVIAFDLGSAMDDITGMKTQLQSFSDPEGQQAQSFAEMKTLPGKLDTLLTDLEYLKTEQYYKEDGSDNKEWIDIEAPLSSINTACAGNEIVTKEANCGGGKTYGTDCFKVSDAGVVASMGCEAVNIQKILDWQDKKNGMVDLKSSQTTNLKTELQTLIDTHEAYIVKVEDYNDAVIAILDFVAHEETGFLNELHCFWFGEQLDNFHDTLCVAFVSSCYNMAFVMGWFSFSMFFGSFFLFVSVKRMGFEQKQQKEIQPKKGEDAAIATGVMAGGAQQQQYDYQNVDQQQQSQQMGALSKEQDL